MSGSGGASIRRADLLTLSNLRNDGRKPHELRRISMQLGCCTCNEYSGSAVVTMGLTSALATVTGPTCDGGRRKSDELPSNRSAVEVTVAAAAFATADRRSTNPRADRRLLEISELIQRALEATILLETYHLQSKIFVHVTILADDGGRLAAAVNAASLALVDAGIPMRDMVCSCTAGCSDSNFGSTIDGNDPILIDLNRREESTSGIVVPCAILPQRGTLVLMQCEARVSDMETLEQVIEAAMEGCRAIFDYMQAAVKERATLTLAARSGRATILAAFVPKKH